MLAELQRVESADVRLPGVRAHVLHALDTAYAALTHIESELDELEAQHQRLGEAMEASAEEESP